MAETSDEEDNDEQVEDSEEEKTPVKEKKKKEKKEKKVNEENEESEKPKKKKHALLTMKLSESDSSEGEAKYRRKMERKTAAAVSGDSNGTDTEISKKNGRKKSKPRKAIISSDDENGLAVSSEDSNDEGSNYEDEDADSDKSGTGNKKKRKKRVSSSDEDSDSDGKPKRRKRIRGGDSDTEGDDAEEASPNKGRHEIRKVIKDKHLSVGAKEAVAEERERRKRIEERQSLYNKSFKLPEADKEGGTCEKLVLDFDPETMEVLVEVNKRLVKKLKPHQVGGVKFMWDACFESLEQIKSGKTPGGAILAHCMGLGKTLQTVTLTHTVLDNKRVGVSRVSRRGAPLVPHWPGWGPDHSLGLLRLALVLFRLLLDHPGSEARLLGVRRMLRRRADLSTRGEGRPGGAL